MSGRRSSRADGRPGGATGRERARRQGQGRGRHAGQHGDGMLELLAGHAGRDQLRLGAGQLGLRLGDIGRGGGAGVILVLCDAQRFLVGLDRVGEQLGLGILAAQLEIIVGERFLGRERGIGEIGGADVGTGLVAFDLAADAAPQVQIPARRPLCRIDRAGAAAAAAKPGRRDAARPTAAAAATAAGDAGRQADRGQLLRAGLVGDGERLGVLRLEALDVLVREGDLGLEPVQDRIVIDRPPGALGDGVAGGAELPARGCCGRLLEGGAGGRVRALIVGADGAAGHQQQGDQGNLLHVAGSACRTGRGRSRSRSR